MSLILVLGRHRQRQADPCELQASLVYSVSSRTAKSTQRNPVLNRPLPHLPKGNHHFYLIFYRTIIAWIVCMHNQICYVQQSLSHFYLLSCSSMQMYYELSQVTAP